MTPAFFPFGRFLAVSTFFVSFSAEKACFHAFVVCTEPWHVERSVLVLWCMKMAEAFGSLVSHRDSDPLMVDCHTLASVASNTHPAGVRPYSNWKVAQLTTRSTGSSLVSCRFLIGSVHASHATTRLELPVGRFLLGA